MKALVLAGLLLSAVSASCGGGRAPVVPGLVSAVAHRDVEDGAAKLSTTIELEFDRPTKLAKSDTPLTSHFEIRAPQLTARGETYERIFVTSASFAEGSDRRVVLSAAALVPDGSILKVARRAFDRSASGEIEAPIESDLSLEAATLATLRFTFGDPGILDAGPTKQVTDADRDTPGIRALLEQHLLLRGSSPDIHQKALALFDAIPPDRVPGPKARAALAALTGTFAEPAIAAFLAGEKCGGNPASLISFQTPPGDARLLARVTTAEDGARVVSLSPELESERFEMLMPLLLHEAIHCDGQDGLLEEVAATAFDTFFYLHLVAIDPALVTGQSRLQRDMVVDALAMMNSGRRYPESAGVLRSAGASQALPGSNNPATSFAEFVAAAYGQVGSNSSPDEAVALAYASTLAAAANAPEGSPFDLRYLDELLGAALDPSVMAAAINALDLIPAS